MGEKLRGEEEGRRMKREGRGEDEEKGQNEKRGGREE